MTSGPLTAGRAPRDLTVALTLRLRRTPPGPLLARREATVTFAPTRGEAATVELHHGQVLARRGIAAPAPTTWVRGQHDVLSRIVQGTDSGVRAFLDGDVTVRGDLSLALALDGLFTADADRPARWPLADLVTAGGVDTAYLDAGPRDAPPVVLLHGLGATNASLLPLLYDLAADYRVIAPDLPGFGASGAPRASYSAAWFAHWVHEFCAALQLRTPVLIGNSMGGRIALETGLEHPGETSGLVLLCPSPAFRRLRQWVPAVRLIPPELASAPFLLSHALVVRSVRTMLADPSRLPTPWYDAAADEVMRVFHDRAHRVAFFSAMRQIYLDDAFGRQGFWSRLPTLAPPALFVWGERDRLVPASFARHVATALPQAESIVLDDCGHVPQFEAPQRTSALVRAFLNRADVAKGSDSDVSTA